MSGMTEKSKDEKQDGPPLSLKGRGGAKAPGAGPGIEFERPRRSSDPRVNAAQVLVSQNRFAEALEILLPLAKDHPGQTAVQFLLGLAASRWSQDPGVEEKKRLLLLDAAIEAFRSILIHQPGLVRVRLELALAFFLKEEDDLARNHFERVLVGRPPAAVVANVRNFLNVMRARRRWSGYFGFSLAPDTNINAASDAQVIYINGLPFRRGAQGQASSDIGVVGWGGAEYQYPLAARWRLRTGFNVNHREYKGGQFDQTFLGGYVGPRWLFSRDDRTEPAGLFEPALVGRLPLQLRFRRPPGSGAPALRGPAAERPGGLAGPEKPAAEVHGRAAHGVLPGRVLRPFPDRAGERL